MTTKVYKTILTKDGYLLNKKKFKDTELTLIKKELTVEPKIAYTLTMGSKSEKFEVYRENDEYLSIPKFYGLKRIGKPELNEEINGEDIKFKFKGTLRPNQKEIVDTAVKHIKEFDGGGICVGCGAGKTVMGINIANIFKVKTLVIVHKTFLLNQWKERFTQFTDAKVGMIQQNKIDVGKKDYSRFCKIFFRITYEEITCDF